MGITYAGRPRKGARASSVPLPPLLRATWVPPSSDPHSPLRQIISPLFYRRGN